MERIFISQTPKHIGKVISLSGWVNNRRDHGKLVFVDLRDITGIIQTVVIPDGSQTYETAKKLRQEYVIEISGLVKERPASARNENNQTGGVEIEVQQLIILNESKTPPFEVLKDTKNVHEDLRLQYRYLDLRTERMAKNLIMRSKIIKFMRDYYTENNFIEVETPVLTKGTPEGSREYVVPSRIHKGKFYVLPQSPQQFKQLLMVAGIDRYFQVAKCFRDEDQRGDRQPEFTQFDLEMSFVKQEEVMQLFEKCMIELIAELYPEKKIQSTPFPVLTFAESMEKYGNDKPDLRINKNDPNELAFCWIVDFPMFEKNDQGEIGATHHPFTAPMDEDVEYLNSEPLKARAKAYDIVLNGYEIGGGSIRIHSKDIQHKIFEILEVKEEDIRMRFGHMLDAFTYGAPPHGGMAGGLDRIIMILQDEPNIRETMAFPKTGEAEDLLMGAPSFLDETQLGEAGIRVVKRKKKTV
jgi:aspartyl-tRNA synthetase